MLGLIFFVLYIGDLFEVVSFVFLYMYVDDMIIYCIGELVDFVINMFNNVLKELEDWSLKNNLVFYFKKCEVMMLL